MAGRTVVVEQAPVGSAVDRASRGRTSEFHPMRIPVGDRLLERLYYGRLRRPVRAVLTRALGATAAIVRGPLKGCRFETAGPAYLLGVYELPVVYTMLDVLREGDVVYDVGANEGYFSLLAGRQIGSTGFVYAFEALPQNAQKVTAHLAANNIGHAEVVPSAISDRAGAFPLAIGDAATPSLVRGDGNAIRVNAITLDGFVACHPRPDLIKMDIEGAEMLALHGALELIRRDDAPRWIIEVHSAELHRGVTDLLREAGYAVSVLVPTHKPPRKAYPCHVIAEKDRGLRRGQRH
jgi:FkbM family methyltransferase